MKLLFLPLLILFLLSLSLPSFSADPPPAPADGLVAYWPLDKVEDGKVRDTSGNGHDGAVVNAQFVERGRIAGCLEFNGKDAYVDCGPPAAYGIADAMTIAVWARPESHTGGGRHRFVAARERRQGDLADGFTMGCEIDTKALGCWMGNIQTQERYSFYAVTDMVPRLWQHAVLTYAKDGGATFFQNGKRIMNERWFKGPIGMPNASLCIGTDRTYFMKGLIDEVRIYNRVLSDAEIRQLCDAVPPIPVAAIKLEKDALPLAVGSLVRLEFAIEPYNARNLSVVWRSSEPKIATVTGYGEVKGLRPGKATVTVTTDDGGFSASCAVDVRVQSVAKVSLDKPELRLEEGRTEKLAATVEPADATNKVLAWSSSNPAIAAVDGAGAVTALKFGEAVITATAADGGGAAASCNVAVWKEPVAGIAFDKPEVAVKAGEWAQLAVIVQPEKATRRNIIRFRSSDPAVASVDQAGIVIARSAGTAKITAEAKDGGFTAECTVTVPPFGTGVWSKVIVLREHLKNFDPHWPALQNGWYDFPEELVSYELSFPRNKVKASGLRLTAAAGQPLEYQLSDVVANRRGFLEKATLSFRTGLARGEIKGFIVDYDPDYDHDADAQQRVTIVLSDNNTAIVAATCQQIEVPAGKVVFPGGRPPKDVPGPIIRISRNPWATAANQNWTGPASFSTPDELKVVSVAGSPIEEGLLRVRYQVEYEFTGGRKYRVVLTVQHDEQHVTVDEYLDGFQPDDNAWLKFSFAKGIDPDGRLVEANGTYKLTTYRGHFDSNLKRDGRLPYELGLYTPNSYGLTWATVFWKDAGEHALIFTLYRMEDWKTARRHVWSSFGPHNLAFYCTPDDKYMITRLEGTERHWALGVIPRSEVVLTGKPDNPRVAGKTWLVNRDFIDFPGLTHDYYYFDWTYGPEIMLFRKLTDRSLDRYKDQIYNWGETEWLDLPADVTAADWTTERARKVWSFYIAESDVSVPHRSMMAGHPNFVLLHLAASKIHLAQALAAYPHHPHAPRWKAEFMGFFNEWLDLFVRKDDPERNTMGGRFTENLPCYSVHSMMGVYDAAKCLKQYDGTDLFALPAVRQWLRYYLQVLMPTENGVRLFPPQGAHASGGLPPENNPHPQSNSYRPNLVKIARWLRDGADKPLGDTLLWSLTKGTRAEEGSPAIALRSALLTDYGAVLWHDFGGPHEAYVNVQQLAGRGYRWSPAANGTVYYCAQGDKWSWNGDEESGDQFNITRLTLFNVNGAGLGHHAADGVLYDLGGAQLYRALGSNGPYLSRGVMMIRDEFIAICDDMDGDASGAFQWFGGRPHVSPIRTGPGDNLHVVSPRKIEATAKPYGAAIGGREFVLMADRDLTADDAALHFEGRTAYARGGELALFEGTALRLGKFAISRSGGDFGFSASLAPDGSIAGRIAGHEGGTITIAAPGLDAGKLRVMVQGRAVRHKAVEVGISFDVEIAVREGCKEFRVERK